MTQVFPQILFPLDHVGIAVTDLDAEILRHQNQFGHSLVHREKVLSHGVEVAFLALGTTEIELLTPISAGGPLKNFLEKKGPGLHHLCYRVENIEAELQRLAASGVQLIDKTPRAGSRQTLIAFLHPKSTGGVLTELCQRM